MDPRTEEQYQQFLIRNYGAPPISLVSGSGSRVTDDEGRTYLDFTTGIAVNALGHSHPDWVKAVQEQATRLTHCSNLFANPLQAELAERLNQNTPAGKVLFCNSGAEANEALIKLARLHGRKISGREGKRFTVLTAENAFHGRTFGGMAATPQEKIQSGFRPMLKGFRHAKLNDIDSFKKAVDRSVCAVLVETIQGEGGIYPADEQFLRDLRELCTERGVMLMVDEVQCGIGRSGKFFAYHYSGIEPDAIGMAKGLGGGFPIGAIWTANAFSDLFTPGSHGTTFGGTPLACSAALAVLNVLERDNLIEQVARQGTHLMEALLNLQKKFPERIREIRGKGYLVGIALNEDHLPIVARLRDEGLLTAPAGGQTVRFIPPLTASMEELDEAVGIFERVLKD
ncbi:MAG: aspartate aminotransferase family protein [Verrucomicrobiota bacterium]